MYADELSTHWQHICTQLICTCMQYYAHADPCMQALKHIPPHSPLHTHTVAYSNPTQS